MSEEAATETETAEGTMFGESERPDWLLDKFNSAEDQAKGYSELYKAYSKKTDDLRQEIAQETQNEYFQSLGVPDDIDGYQYPEGWETPEESIDQTLRQWAKNNNVGTDAFQSLISDVYAKTQTDFEQERSKLGENADSRINAVNKWIHKNIDEQHFDTIRKVMTNAEGVEFFESMIKSTASAGFAPDDVGMNRNSQPLTRESIRREQADPRFGDDMDYTNMVRQKWQQFAKQEEMKSKR